MQFLCVGEFGFQNDSYEQNSQCSGETSDVTIFPHSSEQTRHISRSKLVFFRMSHTEQIDYAMAKLLSSLSKKQIAKRRRERKMEKECCLRVVKSAVIISPPTWILVDLTGDCPHTRHDRLRMELPSLERAYQSLMMLYVVQGVLLLRSRNRKQ